MPRTRTVVLLGPPGAGKTSFFNRCAREGQEYTFNPQHISTTRIDAQRFMRKAGDTDVEFELVDTMGGAIFGTHMTGGSVFVGVRVILFMFDLNSKRSWSDLTSSDRFDNIEYEIARRKGRMEQVDCLVVGTHSDLPHKVEREEIDEFVDKTRTTGGDSEVPVNFFRLEKKFFECSSKTGDGIREIMDYVAKTMALDDRSEEEDNNVIKLGKTKAESKANSDCC